MQEGFSTCVIEAVYALSVGSLWFCMDGERLVLLLVYALMHLISFMFMHVQS